MFRGYKYRIYPTKSQMVLIDKHIGTNRFIYNLALETKQSAWAGNRVNLSWMDLAKQLPELKKECPWLKEVNSQTIQQAIINLDSAYSAFFKGNTDFPRYKSKRRGRQSFQVPQNVEVDFQNGLLHIPKFKRGIPTVFHREFRGEVKSATICRTPTGKYFASLLVDTGEQPSSKPKVTETGTVGIDLGIKDFLTTSDGEVFANPRHLKTGLQKLKYTQTKYSKYKGKRTRQRLAVLHEKIANRRRDFLHKVSTQLIRENQSIAVEDLNVSGMMKNHRLAQSVQDASWGEFIRMLEYKAEWNGRNILTIGRFDSSSKTCSTCGWINKSLTLGEREWECQTCRTHHDRDRNAATNIKSFAIKQHTKILSGTDRKNRGKLPTLVGAKRNTPTKPTPSLAG